VQGEQKQTVTEDQMLDALLAECRELAAKVRRGAAKLHGCKKVSGTFCVQHPEGRSAVKGS